MGRVTSTPHGLHVLSHGPHEIGLAEDIGAPAVWTDLRAEWLRATAPSRSANAQSASLSTKGIR